MYLQVCPLISYFKHIIWMSQHRKTDYIQIDGLGIKLVNDLYSLMCECDWLALIDVGTFPLNYTNAIHKGFSLITPGIKVNCLYIKVMVA